MAALILKTLLFTVLAPGVVTVGIPYALLARGGEVHRFDPSGSRWVGVALIAAGVAIYASCAWNFVAAGRGTPAPWDAPEKLVVRGLYHLTRNPMYVGIVSILFGEGLAIGSATLLLYAVVMLAVFHLAVVAYEEPRLRKQFGPQYDHYCATVRRWLGRR